MSEKAVKISLDEVCLPLLGLTASTVARKLKESIHGITQGSLVAGDFVDQGSEPFYWLCTETEVRGWFPIIQIYTPLFGRPTRRVGKLFIERGTTGVCGCDNPIYERATLHMYRSFAKQEGSLPGGSIEFYLNEDIEHIARRDHRLVVFGNRLIKADLSANYPSEWFVTASEPVVHKHRKAPIPSSPATSIDTIMSP